MISFSNGYRRFRYFVVIIIVALIWVTLGCGGTDEKGEDAYRPGIEWVEDARERVSDTIEDPGRRAEIMAMIKQLEKDLMAVDRVVLNLYADIDALNKDYDATPADFEAAIAKFEAGISITRLGLLNTRRKIRTQSTPEEWEALTDIKKRKGLYKESIRLPQK